MTRHVVFGTGQIGRLVAETLVRRGIDVRDVNRDGRGTVPGAEVVGGDATDPDFPPLQHGVLAAARAAGARLVVLENLYAYGPTGGRDLAETLPASPSSAKAATRAAMTEELLQAHAGGDAEVAIGRASDYFGPGAARSALGETVFGTAVIGRTAQVMGDPDTLHSYSYTPDVAAGLVTLALSPEAPGRVWHLPVAPARTTREIVAQVYALAGRRPRLFAAGGTTLRLLGLVKPGLGEYRHTLYQFTDRWVIDDSRFRAAFGQQATDLDDAIGTTFAWYRDGAPAGAGARP